MGVCGESFGELVGTGGKAFSAMLCFMFALVHRTMPNVGGAWICARLPLFFCFFVFLFINVIICIVLMFVLLHSKRHGLRFLTSLLFDF